MTGHAFGGYFGLEAGAGGGLPWLAGARCYQSARAALVAALQGRGIQRIHVPHFICTAATDALAHLGIDATGYGLAPGRRVPADLRLGHSERLLCVDYFGLTAAACDEAIARFGADNVIVDASQSLFHRPREGVATIHSPRKFVGVPDGGLLANARGESGLPADERASIARCEHLLLRAAGLVEEGYRAFQVAERSLDDCRPVAMSRLTRRMLDGLDAERIRQRRRSNYLALSAALAARGHQVESLPDDAVPLCCPVPGVDALRLRPALAARRIFTPGYWPDAAVPVDDGVGLALRDRTVYLPCDQRYDARDMTLIAQSFIELEGTA
jgi:hypothetical protein